MRKTLSFLLLFMTSLAFSQLGTEAPWMQNLEVAKNSDGPTYEQIKAAGEAYWQTHDKEAKGSGYKPFMRWVDQAEAYVKADGTIQTTADIELAINSRLAKNVQMDNSNWLPVGPFTYNNSGSWSPGQGRVNALVVDPNNSNIYYMGTPGGGAWKSTDAGVTWMPLTDFFTRIGTSAIAVDPTDSNVIYIGTGDDDGGHTSSIGLYKSTDGGANFSPTGLTFTGNSANISEVYLDPTNSNTVFVSSNTGFYRSTDAGASFTRTLTANVKDIKLKPGDSSTIYLSTTNSFYISNNAGLSWTQITSGLPANQGRSVIGVSPANPAYVYLLIIDSQANLVGVYRSIDSGINFVDTGNTSDILEHRQGWYNLALEVSPTNADIIYTGCLNVWKSFNGGTTFSKVNNWNSPSQPVYTHADIHQIRQFGNELFVLSDGGVYRSTNDGTSFTDLTATAQIGQFYRVAVSDQSSNDIVGGLQDNGGFARNTTGWHVYYGADGMDGGIDPINPDIRYGFIQSGRSLYFTTTGGNTRAGRIPGPASGNWITPLKADSRGNIYAGYTSLYTVSGASFSQVSQNFGSNIDVIEIDPLSDDTIYIAIDKNLYRSTNAGVNFLLVSTFPENITAIEVNNNDSSILYIATRFSTGRVYRSIDGGSSFQDITLNLPNLGKNTLVHQGLSSDEPLFVGTTVGVYRYDDVSSTWNVFGNNLPNVNIRDLEINTNDMILTAATYGRGVWQTGVQRVSAPDDISLSALESDLQGINCNSSDITVTVQNTGLNTINNYTLSYSLDNGSVVTRQETVTIAPQAFSSTIISGLNLGIGDHELNIEVQIPNDTFVANNSSFILLSKNRDAVINDVHQFDTRAFLESGSLWERGVPNGIVLNTSGAGGNSNVYATNLDGQYTNSTISYLYSGCYDLSNVQNPIVQFDMAFEIETNWDLLYLEYSVDSGDTWNILGTANDPNWYNSSNQQNNSNCVNCVGAQWTGTQPALTQYSHDLTQFMGEPAVMFRFKFQTDRSITREGAVIDNFVVTGTLSNDEVSGLENMFTIYPNPSSGLFQLSWNGDSSFDYEVYDVSGKRILVQQNNSGNQHLIDLNTVASGMYFLKITSDNASVTEKLLVR
ncbi:T9SS type A sorting domain-containing protein [Nonlabens xiamenensis]|uniref:T9SS type A sorting domain-containing protein n=1 Tax=Nonlabens xiamenensis TaxID=2341043 RepID=UPI000F611A4D|nr:T9SS type A sorting domain-containing protein [Nonlabens xiamenensis]